MRHELLHIIDQAITFQQLGIKSVMATVVALEGSSYRRPGVRMLLSEKGQMIGAVSGGCVEKEVYRRSQAVFQSGQPEVMTYDGRYRLGCEGLLYILLEPVLLSEAFIGAFTEHQRDRRDWNLTAYFEKKDQVTGPFGSVLQMGDYTRWPFSSTLEEELEKSPIRFEQVLAPRFQLILIGAEHDAVALTRMASQLGWEVEVVSSLNDPRTLSSFPGASRLVSESPQTYPYETIDPSTAVVLMTHNYSLDLRYLSYLQQVAVSYLGILGSTARSARLQNELMDAFPDLSLQFLERIYSPAGLNLRAETPEEIALSILSEILTVTRKASATSLRSIKGSIHDTHTTGT